MLPYGTQEGTMNTRHLRPEHLAGLRWRGYIRESTQRQAEAWSPERQRQDIIRAADELGMVAAPDPWYERTGTGEAVSDELDRALTDKGQYDVLIVLTTSRFARNRVEAGRRKAEFAAAGIPIYFVQDRIVSGARASRLLEGIREVLDEEENEQRRFWVAGGLRQRQASGRWVGVIPIGYRKRLVDFPDGTRGWDGHLEVDEPTAVAVVRIYDEATRGFGTRAIAAGLNADGVPSGSDRGWTFDRVHDILTNAVYSGRLVRYRREHPTAYYDHDGADGRADFGEHVPAIIPAATWRRAQTALRRRRATRATAPTGRQAYMQAYNARRSGKQPERRVVDEARQRQYGEQDQQDRFPVAR
jgi:DNA invertase Pin-like site-specific DNA recombinase